MGLNLNAQGVSRCYLARRHTARLRTVKAAETRSVREAAAVTIQAAIRGLFARRALRVRVAAAVVIQAAIRGWLGRKLLACMRVLVYMQLMEAAATQQAVRQRAATVLQAAARGMAVRRLMRQRQKMIAEHHVAATVLQAAARRFLVRRAHARLRTAAVAVQRATRAWLVERRRRQVQAAAEAVREEAVLVIQGVSRCYLARKRAHRLRTVKEAERRQAASLAMRQTAAATHLQAGVRGWLERVRFRRLRWATACIQAAARTWLSHRRACSQDRAALHIQVRVYPTPHSCTRDRCPIRRARRTTFRVPNGLNGQHHSGGWNKAGGYAVGEAEACDVWW